MLSSRGVVNQRPTLASVFGVLGMLCGKVERLGEDGGVRSMAMYASLFDLLWGSSTSSTEVSTHAWRPREEEHAIPLE
jgi:hypothetical protein